MKSQVKPQCLSLNSFKTLWFTEQRLVPGKFWGTHQHWYFKVFFLCILLQIISCISPSEELGVSLWEPCFSKCWRLCGNQSQFNRQTFPCWMRWTRMNWETTELIKGNYPWAEQDRCRIWSSVCHIETLRTWLKWLWNIWGEVMGLLAHCSNVSASSKPEVTEYLYRILSFWPKKVKISREKLNRDK